MDTSCSRSFLRSRLSNVKTQTCETGNHFKNFLFFFLIPFYFNRAFIYWRLLAIDPELTKKIVFAERPTISDSSYTLDSALLDMYFFLHCTNNIDNFISLIENIGSLSSVYTKRPETFVKKLREVQNIRHIKEIIIIIISICLESWRKTMKTQRNSWVTQTRVTNQI